jgi:dephospho-CoA kinase
MKVIGLTGSIGMGKTTAAGLLRRMGIPVHEGDAAVHRLLGAGGEAVAEVAAAFPGTVHAGRVDRRALGARVFDDPEALARLEAILHPRVRRSAAAFLARARRRRQPVVVLDVPLLFETGGEAACDATVVLTAPAFVQAARVLARPGMTRARYRDILARQMPDAEKRARADFVIPTGLGRRCTLRALERMVKEVRRGGVGKRRRQQRRQGASFDARDRSRH